MPSVDVKPGARMHDLLELRGNDPGVAEVRRLAALRGGVDASLLGRAIAAWTPERVNADLREAFAVDPFTLMAKAWSQIAKVRDAVTKSVGPPPAPASVPLLKHDIDARLRPRLVLAIEGVDWCDIDFELKLALALESAELELFGGALRGVKLGKATGSVTLACQGIPVEAFRRELKFDSSYTFDPPILGSRQDDALPGAAAPLDATPPPDTAPLPHESKKRKSAATRAT